MSKEFDSSEEFTLIYYAFGKILQHAHMPSDDALEWIVTHLG